MVSIKYFLGVGECSDLKSIPFGVLTSKVGPEETVLINNTGMRSLRNIILFTAGRDRLCQFSRLQVPLARRRGRAAFKESLHLKDTKSRRLLMSSMPEIGPLQGAFNLAFLRTGILCEFAHNNLSKDADC